MKSLLSLILISLFICTSCNQASVLPGSESAGADTNEEGAPDLSPSPDEGRRILKVCSSGCPYNLPSKAIAASADNDIIEVDANDYYDCFTISKNNIKLRGVGGRAHLTGKMCSSKGAIVVTGKDTVIENFEFSNMYVADRNGAGIRHQGLGLLVKNSFFHDGENGILSGRADATPNPLDIITIENSRFEHLGGDNGQAHGVYFGASSHVIIKNSIFVASRDQGHEFKSRAKNTSIECSFVGGVDGVDSYSLNFPDGGVATVKNSVIEQGPYGGNSNIIDYGSEMLTSHPINTIKLSGVTVINDYTKGAFFKVQNATEFSLTNSVLVGPGTPYANQIAIESGVFKKATRALAGIDSYPSFPKPTVCTGTIGLLY